MERIVIIKNCSECNESHNNFAMMNGNAPMGVLSGGAFLGCTKTLHLCPDEGIPDWCPLPLLPEHRHENEYSDDGRSITVNTLAKGWNACLDKITEGKENE